MMFNLEEVIISWTTAQHATGGTGDIMEPPPGRLRPYARPQVRWFRLIITLFRMALTWAVAELRRARDIDLNLQNGK